MARPAFRTISIEIERLKGLRQVRISLQGKPLVALLGTNGSGKSTILYALACAYSPPGNVGSGEFTFPRFFPKTFTGAWNTTEFTITNEIPDGRARKLDPQRFRKDVDQWLPSYDTRCERKVIFIGINSAVPQIEQGSGDGIEYESEEDLTAAQDLVLSRMKAVFNRDYSGLWKITANQTLQFAALQLGTIRYDAFSMGAGEQRVLQILTQVSTAPVNSLILIDEIDLLLHAQAFEKLLEVLHELATREAKNLQIIFTTHRETVVSQSKYVAIRHVHPGFGLLDKTIYLESGTSDVIARLTGRQPAELEIFVEDEFAKQIVQKTAFDLGLSRCVRVSTYGVVGNAFSVAGGAVLSGQQTDNLLVVLDGDARCTLGERESAICNVISGSSDVASANQARALSLLKQFILPVGLNPEAAIHKTLKQLPEPRKRNEREVVQVAKSIQAVSNKHDFIDKMVERLGGYGSNMAMAEIVSVAAKTREWKPMVAQISKWIIQRAKSLNIEPL